jgi:hypothetical protein
VTTKPKRATGSADSFPLPVEATAIRVTPKMPETNPTAKTWELHFYGQDFWRITPRIVLSYGMRYEFQKLYGETHNQLSNFDPSTSSVLIAGAGGNSGTLLQDDRTISRRACAAEIFWEDYFLCF